MIAVTCVLLSVCGLDVGGQSASDAGVDVHSDVAAPQVRLWAGDEAATDAEQSGPDSRANRALEQLRANVANADKPARKLEMLLAEVNWLLSNPIEPMATRFLLDLSTDEDVRQAVAFVGQAKQRLSEAEKIWHTLDDSDTVAPDVRRNLGRALEGLGAFATTFDALWTDRSSDPEARNGALEDASGKMSFVLEDERRDVAAAAQLWQAVLYAQRDANARAMDMLPVAVSEPGDAGRYGFFARVLRCRLMAAADGGYAPAIALLARIEERSLNWYESPTEGRIAQRTAALIRRQMTVQWARALRAANEPKRADWCDQSVGEIDADNFDSVEPNDIMRLGRAIPYLVDVDAAARPPRPADNDVDNASEQEQSPGTSADENPSE